MTPKEASERLNVARSRVYQLLAAGALVGYKVDGEWDITEESVRDYVPRPVGRPKKEA